MRSRRQFLRASAVALGGVFLSANGRGRLCLGAGTTDEPKSTDSALDFETAETLGSIRGEGAYHGVSRLVHKKSGLQVIDARYSALNLFRLFSTNLGMGTPRSMERQVTVADRSVESHWAATEGHQAAITARYHVHEPNVIDLIVTVQCLGTYRDYEILLPSYFDKTLVPHVYLKRRLRGRKDQPEIDRVVPTVNDVFRGGVLSFPRDLHAARMCLDGRWSRSEYAMPVAPFYPVRHYGLCLAVVTDRDERVGAVLMSDPRCCSAISARYYAENDEDRLTSYTAVDFSLFGEDFLPGDERTATVRLVVTGLDGDFARPLELYHAFLAESGELQEGAKT